MQQLGPFEAGHAQDALTAQRAFRMSSAEALLTELERFHYEHTQPPKK